MDYILIFNLFTNNIYITSHSCSCKNRDIWMRCKASCFDKATQCT